MRAVKLLVISHSCIEEVNRAVYRLLAIERGIEVHLVMPSRIRIGAEHRKPSPATNELFEVTLLDLSGSHMRLQRLKGLSRLIRETRPSHILVEADAASFLMRDVVRAAKTAKSKVWSLTAENLERDYLFEGLRGLRSRRLGAGIGGFIAWWLWRSTRRDIDHVFVLSEDGVGAMSKLGFSGRVTRIPLGFDPELFHPQSNEKIVATRRRLGLRSTTIAYFGRLTPEKGVELLLESLGRLKDLDWQLLIDQFATYRTEYTSRLEARIEALGLADRVVYFDASHTEMPNYMNAADVVVLPSISTPKWKEQYGRVIPEAMACGKIVVGSDSGTIPELIADAGYTFPEGDASKLAELLGRIIGAPEAELAAVRTRAKDRARSELSIVRQAAIWSRMLTEDEQPDRRPVAGDNLRSSVSGLPASVSAPTKD